MILAAKQEGQPRRGADHRVRAVRAGSARAAAGASRGRRRGATQVRRREIRFSLLAQAVEVLSGGARAQEIQPQADGSVPRQLPLATTACASGATSTASCTLSSPSSAGKCRRRQASYAQIHRALLAGLLGNIGCKSEDSEHYLGARGIKFLIHPGSGVGKKAGRWIMAAEITETTRLYARCVARIEPEWLESIGAHLIKRQPVRAALGEEARACGRVRARDAVRHCALWQPAHPLRPARPGRVAPDLHPPGAGRGRVTRSRAPFFQHNRKLIHDIETLEHKSRRPDVLVDEELIYAFYDSLIPEGIHNGAAFEHWRREAEAGNPKLLYLKREDLMRHEAAGITTAQFPHQLVIGARSYALEYLHDPGNARDGVTLTVPLDRAEPAFGQALRLAGAGPAEGEGGAAGEDAAAENPPQARAAARICRHLRRDDDGGGAAAPGAYARRGHRALCARGAQPRPAAGRFPPRAFAGAPRDEFCGGGRARSAARDGQEPGAIARGTGRAGRRAVQCDRPAQGRAVGHQDLGFRRTAGDHGNTPGRADADRLSGAHRSRRQRGPGSARCAAEDARAAPRRPAAAVHAAAEGADQVSGKESARLARPGGAVPAFRRCRLAQGPVAARDFRSRLHGRALARDAGAVCEALRRGERHG